MGGLSRRAFLIDTLLEETSQPSLLVDSGNILFNRSSADRVRRQDLLTAQVILDIYRSMNYTAMAVGPNDISGGLELLIQSAMDGSPWVSANLLVNTGEPLFAPWVIEEFGQLRVAILGLTSTVDSLPDGYAVAKWQQVLPEMVAELNATCDFIILLSNLSRDDNTAIAKRFPQIHLLVSAHQKLGNQPPKLVHNTRITQTLKRGKYFGEVNVTWPGLRIWVDNGIVNQEVASDLLQFTSDQLPGYTNQASTVDTSRDILLRLEKDKKLLAGGASENLNEVEGGSFTFKFKALPRSYPEKPEIAEAISRLKQEISKTNSRSSRPASSSSDDTTSNIDYNSGIIGGQSCGSCHQRQTDFWKTTRHAHSLSSLTRSQQQHDLNCLPCHVTRDMRRNISEKGNSLRSLPKSLLAVGCESCHGPAGNHLRHPENTPLSEPIREAVCIQCHTSERDDDFHFTEKLARIRCPS